MLTLVSMSAGGGAGAAEEGRDVEDALGRAQAIDADDAFDARDGRRIVEEGQGALARQGLVLGRHGVFEIDADDVGAGLERLRETCRACRRATKIRLRRG